MARELHANGDLHLHIYLKLSSAFRTTDPRFADLPGGFHGNYQGCRSSKNVLKYCTKNDDFLSNVDISALLSKQSNRRVALESVVTGKRSLVELVQDEPQYLLGYTRLKLDYANFLKDKEATDYTLPPFLPNPWGKVLGTRKSGKKKHYWLYSSRPNVGKTYLFARPLKDDYNAHIRTSSEPYWNLTGREKLIILDEYNGCIFKYYELNSMCDGTFYYRIIYSGIICLNNPLIVILSNKSIKDLYPNMFELLYARFNEIKLD